MSPLIGELLLPLGVLSRFFKFMSYSDLVGLFYYSGDRSNRKPYSLIYGFYQP